MRQPSWLWRIGGWRVWLKFWHVRARVVRRIDNRRDTGVRGRDDAEAPQPPSPPPIVPVRSAIVGDSRSGWWAGRRLYDDNGRLLSRRQARKAGRGTGAGEATLYGTEWDPRPSHGRDTGAGTR